MYYGFRRSAYKVWKTNRFNENILVEPVAYFYDFKKAKDFVYEQSKKCENHVITLKGKIIDID